MNSRSEPTSDKRGANSDEITLTPLELIDRIAALGSRHHACPRVITPREAARIQAFPDSFRFVVNSQDPPRNALTKWIGDAVPPVLGYAALYRF